MSQACKFIFLLLLLSGTSVWANDPVFEARIPDQTTINRTLKIKYDVNLDQPDLKRAWLKAYYDEPFLLDSDGPLPHPENIQVPGLSYDPQAKEITYSKKEGGLVVCATKVDSGFIKGLSYHETGKCVLDLSPAVVQDDNGLTVKRQHVIKIHFFIRE